MRIGYGRVSTRDQNPDGQRDALTVAGCDEIYVDKASGKLASRPELERALLVAGRTGDQLVVTKVGPRGNDGSTEAPQATATLWLLAYQPVARSHGADPRARTG